MNRFFLLFMMMAFTTSIVNAQSCEPDPTLPDSVVISPLPYTDAFPTDGIQDTACVNGYFETVLNFNIPATYEFNGNTLNLSYVAIAESGGINNLPASFGYVCNPPNCQFLGDTTGCLVIYGTATEDEIGQYDLTMSATLNVAGLNIPQVLPGAVVDGNYFLFIQPEGSPNCTIVDVIDAPVDVNFSIVNSPNPTDGYTEFVITTEESGLFDFTIHDFLGKEVMNKKINTFIGKNTISFDASGLSSGMYIYTLRKGKDAVSGKLLVARQ